MSQGWHQNRNNVMCFYQCEVNFPSMLNQLSKHVDVLVKENTNTSNTMATPYVCKGDDRNLDIESKKALSDALLTSKCKIDKWMTPKTRNATNIKNVAIDEKRKTKKDRNIESDAQRNATKNVLATTISI